MTHRRSTGVVGLAAILLAGLISPFPCHGAPALLAIIIDDLGNARSAGERTASLPGPVTCSVLPHTPLAAELAESCRKSGKEVLVHLPMQPEGRSADPGPGALRVGQTRAEFEHAVEASLVSVPGAGGLSSHMGSLLTRHIGYMDWLMTELSRRGDLIFIDSATTAHSVALRLARDHGLPAARRDLFLDDDPSPDAIRAQWQRGLSIAQRQGSAILIGHPREHTLSLLEAEIAKLDSRGIMLVSISDVVRVSQAEGSESWQPSSYRSHQASRR